jgi:hypothetical protein
MPSPRASLCRQLVGWAIIAACFLQGNKDLESGHDQADRNTTCQGVNKHQDDIERQNNGQPALGERHVRATVEDVSSAGADGEFDGEERDFAVLDEGGHERVSFGRDIHPHPKQCKLGVEPIESEEEQAFGQDTH